MQLGHVTSDHAYTPALAKMKARAMVQNIPVRSAGKSRAIQNIGATCYQSDSEGI